MSKYVFIVGLPRTGTKLIMNSLASSKERRWSISPENFFLGRAFRSGVRHQLRQLGSLSQEAVIRTFVEQMYGNRFQGEYWERLAAGDLNVDPAALLQAILNSDRSERAVYDILLKIHTAAEGEDDRLVIGDKTGPHLYHVPTLLAWFPEAKIIHTFRDPRAVLASEHKKLLRQFDRKITKAQDKGAKLRSLFLKMQRPGYSLMIVFYITAAWLYAARLHRKYQKQYPNNYYLSKFEALVSQPETSLRKLCAFLEIEFEAEMLDPPKVGSSYTQQDNSGFDKETLNRWQNYLKPWMKVWLRLWGSTYLREFGYS